jgi:copper chaperone NosL
MTIKNSLTCLAVALTSTFFVSCSNDDTADMIKTAVTIEASDQCHLCGMVISNFGGPKGELASKDTTEVSKFCSTRDLFGFYLQPENKHRAENIYVHDMSVTPWESPDDEHFIDAKTAHYVWGSSKKGAMGDTLGSFSNHMDAMAFAKEFGGKVYKFDEVTLELLSNSMAMSSEMHMDTSSEMNMDSEMSSDEHNH